jgi:hypothetical protein
MYMPLSSEDMKNDKWRFAPIVVATNRERVDIVAQQAREFARTRGIPVVRWLMTTKSWAHSLTTEQEAEVKWKDPCFYHYCVFGANAFVSKNLNTRLKITNGTPCRIHSLSFETMEETEDFKARFTAAPVGSEITLAKPPLSVNIVPWPDDNEWNDECREFSMFSLIDEFEDDGDEYQQVVIPLLAGAVHKVYASSTSKSDEILVRGTDKTSTSKAVLQQTHAFDLGFAMTYFKIQGRTIEKLVIDVCQPPNYHVNYHMLLVAHSRVQKSDDMRHLFRSDPPKRKVLEYMYDLKPDKDVMHFLAGVKGDGSKWDMKASLAHQKEWEGKKEKPKNKKRPAMSKSFAKQQEQKRKKQKPAEPPTEPPTESTAESPSESPLSSPPSSS